MNIKIPLWIKELKDYVPLIILVTSIAGSLGQFINLFMISPGVLGFFSASEILIKGVFFLSVAFIILIIVIFFFQIVYQTYLKFPNTKNYKVSAGIILIVLIGLLFKYDILLFVLTPGFIMIVILLMDMPFGDLMELNNDEIESNKDVTQVYNFFCILYAVNLLLAFTTYDTPHAQKAITNIPEKLCMGDHKNCFELKYYNSQYVFYKNNNDSVIVKSMTDMMAKNNTIEYKEAMEFDIKDSPESKEADSIILEMRKDLELMKFYHEIINK